VESGNRKLIRPSFNEFKEKSDVPRKSAPAPQKRQIPPDQTNAENFYYVKQMQSKTPMVITLKDGEVLKGVIEWYDRSCLKLNRDGDPNLLLYKSNIKYMYKDEDA
jgi:host factor-I protein